MATLLNIPRTRTMHFVTQICKRIRWKMLTVDNRQAAALPGHILLQTSFSDQKPVLDDLMKIVQQTEAGAQLQRNARVTSTSSYKWLKSSKYGGNKPKYSIHDQNGQLVTVSSVEKQLQHLMLMWEMEDTVKLLREAVINGIEPSQVVILDLLQQLANLGEVECLLELHEFLLDRGLNTNLRFYHCLRDAYFNSGRIDEGMSMLRIIYHGSRDFDDADLFFTLLATMTMKHFKHHISLLVSFVEDLENSDPPVPSARASLWRCYVLAEQFEQADQTVKEHEHVRAMIPAQVTKLLQSPLEMDYNKDMVFQWLQNLPDIKAGLKASVFDSLMQHKSKQGEWAEGLELLSTAMENNMKIHQHTVQTFLSRFLTQLSEKQIEKLTDWAKTLMEISDDQMES